MRGAGGLTVAAAALACALVACTPARWAIVVDNDVFAPGNDDQDYSHGARVEFHRPLDRAHPVEDGLFRALSYVQFLRPPTGALAGAQSFALTQRSYTPRDIRTDQFLPDDRPYAAWLELRSVRTEAWLDDDPDRRRDRLERVALGVGTTGPSAGAREFQNLVHEVLNQPRAEGWEHQTAGEITVQLESLSRFRLAFARLSDDFEADVALDGDWRLGNYDTSAGLALRGRLGWQLPRAEGLWTSAPWADPTGSAWVYVTVGGRGSAYDATLDGAMFEDDLDYEHDAWTAHAEAGGVLLWRQFALGYAVHVETNAFDAPYRLPAYGRLTAGFAGLW